MIAFYYIGEYCQYAGLLRVKAPYAGFVNFAEGDFRFCQFCRRLNPSKPLTNSAIYIILLPIIQQFKRGDP